MAGNEIASAWITLTTKMPGVKKDIENALGQVDGTDAGGKLGDGLGKGISNKQAAIAGAVGGVFASVANLAAGAIGNLFADAVAQSDATDKFASTLSFAGLDTSAVEAATAASKAYADQTVYDLGTIQNTTAQLAANGVGNYSELTEAAGNLNAVAGGNADTFSSVAMALTQTAGQGKLTTENWDQLADAIPGASGKLQEALANAGAYTGNFRDAMAEGQITAEEFNAAILELGTQPVAVEAAASVDTMEGAVGNLSASITGALADAFTAIKPFLTDFIAGLAGAVTWIQDNISWIGPLAAGIAIVAGAVGLWSAAQWILNAALTANPIGLIIVGIGLLIGAIILLVQNWDTVVAWITDIWGGFIGWITDGLNAFVGWWNGIWAAVGAWIAAVWNTIVATVQGVWNGFIGWITGVTTGFVGWWNGIWAQVGAFIGAVWNTIVATIQGVWNGFWGWVVGAVGGFLGWWNGIWKAVGDTWNNIWSGMGSFVSSIWQGIIGGIRGYINTLIGLINGIINGVNVLIGGAGAIIGLDLKIPNIPKLAQGGIVSASAGGTLAVIGEGGRDEAVIPLPDDWRQNGFGGGSTFNVYPQVSDGRLLVRQMADELRRAV